MSQQLETLLSEQTLFEPPESVRERAKLQDYEATHKRSLDDNEAFWGGVAEQFIWETPWQQVLEFDGIHHEWFVGAKTNITINALDRHIDAGRGDHTAYVWLGEDGSEQRLTYRELLAKVCRVANGLKAHGVEKGDRVVLYMPLTLEGVACMLACARIGAVHSVVYAGFAAPALRARIQDAGAKLVIAADAGYRRGKTVDLGTIARDAVAPLDDVTLVMWQREGDLREGEVSFETFADRPDSCPAEIVDAEHPLFILYTSGTTGQPKGVVHVHGGYMVGTSYHGRHFLDLGADDVFFNMSDIGWIVGHSYICYAPLLIGCTTLFREGAPDTPDPGVIWRTVDDHKVTVMFTAPTAVRMWMRVGESIVEGCDLSTLRVLACAGEPLNPEAFRWAQQHITGDHGYVMDNWWQTELPAPTLATFAVHEHKPGFVGRPTPGVDIDVVDEEGRSQAPNQGGYLVLKRPLPHMMRTIYNDDDRYQAIWQSFPGMYFTGDVAVRDEAGRFSVLGRADDVLNVAGHRIGTADVESALVSHKSVAESAVIGVPDAIKGEAIKVFVVVRQGVSADDALAESLKEHVRNELGPIATPSSIAFVEGLPKTRSGKIMRRLLKAQELGQDPGDTSTLEH